MHSPIATAPSFLPLVCAAAAALAASASAQSEPLTAHPQDQPHTYSGQLNPFSDDSIRCEARSQLQIHAEHLPGPGAVLVAIEFYGLGGGTVVYESLTFTVSPLPAGAPRSTMFAANLPQPTTVLALTNHTVAWTGTSWERFATTTPYVHDGVSQLVIDIQKDAVPGFGNGGATGLYRPDLETLLTVWGVAGSGAHQSAAATFQVIPIDVRLVWSGVPTARLSSTIPGPNHHGFGVGTSFDHIVNATPNSLSLLIADLQFQAPVVLPIASGQLWVQAVTLGVDIVPASGEVVRNFTLPTNPVFVGQQLVYQALVLDAVSNTFALTNASDLFVGQ